jgi:hypothetical protein
MGYGITIGTHDEIPENLEDLLNSLPLRNLGIELPEHAELAHKLDLEQVYMFTLSATDQLAEIVEKIHKYSEQYHPDRIYFRLFGRSLNPAMLMELFAAVLRDAPKIGFMTPIREINKAGSVTRAILNMPTRTVEYIPMISYSNDSIIPLLEIVKKHNGGPITAKVIPLFREGAFISEWIKEILIPNGVDEIFYPSLIYAKPQFFTEELEMVTKRKSTTKRKPKEILVPVPGEPTNAKVEVLYPIAKRSTPSLNAMVVGTCDIGEQFELVNIVKVSDKLIFGETKEKFYICTFANGIEYVKYL